MENNKTAKDVEQALRDFKESYRNLKLAYENTKPKLHPNEPKAKIVGVIGKLPFTDFSKLGLERFQMTMESTMGTRKAIERYLKSLPGYKAGEIAFTNIGQDETKSEPHRVVVNIPFNSTILTELAKIQLSIENNTQIEKDLGYDNVYPKAPKVVDTPEQVQTGNTLLNLYLERERAHQELHKVNKQIISYLEEHGFTPTK